MEREGEGRRIKGKSKYDLSDSYNLQCETTSFHTDSAYFETLRPIPLSEAERRLYKEDALRKDTIQRNIKIQRVRVRCFGDRWETY